MIVRTGARPGVGALPMERLGGASGASVVTLKRPGRPGRGVGWETRSMTEPPPDRSPRSGRQPRP